MHKALGLIPVPRFTVGVERKVCFSLLSTVINHMTKNNLGKVHISAYDSQGHTHHRGESGQELKVPT